MCGLCGHEAATPQPRGAHPLILELDQLTQDVTPRTPRGPAPPWALLSDLPPKDHTATGPTPPRSPRTPRAAPPGIPDDETGANESLSGERLASSLDSMFLINIIDNARIGNTGMLSSMLHQLEGAAFAMVCNAPSVAGASGSALLNERREKASEIVASFLSQFRAPGSLTHETLLGVAASGGHLGVVQLLLTSRADPGVCDDQGCTALHRAAEGGRILPVLMVLDRMQAQSRGVTIAELTNADGETPEMLAALGGASDVCRCFEVFNDMQNDAELRQLGSSGLTSDLAGGHRSTGIGDLIAFIDCAAEVRSTAGLAASALLLRSAVGTGLVQSLFRRIPEDEAEISQFVDRVCHGLRAAEDMLLRTAWNPVDPKLHPAVRALVTTAEVRSLWQRLRLEALISEGTRSLDDFWQTHIPADTMVSTLLGARGDTFQVLLTVLWLYTREAWLRHIVDMLAGAICAGSLPQAGSSPASADGATGATPLCPPEFPPALQPLAPLTDALAPFMQLLQSALGWFEEAGIRHSGATYRPLSLPALGVQRLVDRYITARQESEGNHEHASSRHDDIALGRGAWVALGAGTFFSSMSSRTDALGRLARMRCNVMLVVRPDGEGPCFPKHMSLRGSSVDDCLFPLGALFRIARVTRTLSSDLDPERCDGPTARWPVMIFELEAASRTLEVLETLERRGALAPGEFEAHLQDWVDGAPLSNRHQRLLSIGELLARCCSLSDAARQAPASGGSAGSVNMMAGGLGGGTSRDGGYVSAASGSGSRAERAASLLSQAASLAESGNDPGSAARALLALARCRFANDLTCTDQVVTDGQKAVCMLEEALGERHPETCAARVAWRELRMRVKDKK